MSSSHKICVYLPTALLRSSSKLRPANRTRSRCAGLVLAFLAAVIAAPTGPASAAGANGRIARTDSLVTVGSPSTPFPQNKDAEPSVAIDPVDPQVVAAGAVDELDVGPCNGSSCPFTQGVSISGIYFSFDGGTRWIQPTYTGWSDRTGTPGVGPIGTVPHYYEKGLYPFADSAVAFGPQPDGHGGFSFSRGARLYYANLVGNFSTVKEDLTFKGFEAIAVSHTDDLVAAAANTAAAWSDPAIVDSQSRSSTTASDKEALTTDNAVTSPFFGNAYVCYTKFKGQEKSQLPSSVFISRSTDGGDNWSTPQGLTPSNFINNAGEGHEGCAVRTASNGVVYVVWEDAANPQHRAVFELSRSFDGGLTFSHPQVVAQVTHVGQFEAPAQFSFDGVAGARTDSFPSLDIANGAPSGVAAPNTIALGWSDGSNGLGGEHALVQLSADGGQSWTPPQAVEGSGDRPAMTAVGISPNGQDLYVVYDAFLQGFQHTTATPRQFQGVVRHADLTGATLGNLMTLDRGQVGDARASSTNSLRFEFLGDYNTVVATNAGALAVYNDARNAAVCEAVDGYRQSAVDGSPMPKPSPDTDCPAAFGNVDIYSASAPGPTP